MVLLTLLTLPGGLGGGDGLAHGQVPSLLVVTMVHVLRFGLGAPLMVLEL